MSAYTLRRYEGGGVWLFFSDPTGMEVAVLGGHVIVGLMKKGIAPPGLATWSRIEMVVGGHAHVCMLSCAGLGGKIFFSRSMKS